MSEKLTTNPGDQNPSNDEQNQKVQDLVDSARNRLAEGREKGHVPADERVGQVQMVDTEDGTLYKVLEVHSGPTSGEIEISVTPQEENRPKYNLGHLGLDRDVHSERWKKYFEDNGIPFEPDIGVIETGTFYQMGDSHGGPHINRRANIIQELTPVGTELVPTMQVDAPVGLGTPEFERMSSKIEILPLIPNN